jgi:hypothetical protein
MHDHRSNAPMNSIEFSKILLVQALEESDPHGRHLPISTRHHATQQAREKHGTTLGPSPEGALSFLSTRSEILLAFVDKAFPAFAKYWNHLQIDIPTTLITIPALLTGLLINGLGDSQRVNLLNFPLLILLLWNGWIYLSSALLPLVNSSMKNTWLDTVARRLTQWVGHQGARSWRSENLSDPLAAGHWIQKSTKRFAELWWPHVGAVWTHRLRQLLHLGAACMAMGMILGMYIRGLALDYQATWESTFLSVNQVHGILHILLGPAAWLLHYPFPDISEVARLQAPQHGPAAPWIHMWAVAIFAVIVIPRSILGWLSQRTLNQARETCVLPQNDPYFVHLLAPDRGQGVQIDVMPYSYLPSPEAKNFLDLGLSDLFGNLASIHWHQPIPFGQDFSNPDEASPYIQTSVVIFNAGQTPEGEVHGEWLHSIQTQMDPAQGGSRLLILLDEEPYSQTIDENRVIERRQAWQRLINQYHLSIVPFDVNATSHDQFLQQAQGRLWPTSV